MANFHVIISKPQVIAAGWEDGLVTFTGPAAVNARDDREVHRESRTDVGGGTDLQHEDLMSRLTPTIWWVD